MNKVFGFLFGIFGAYLWSQAWQGTPTYEDAIIVYMIAISGFILHISDQIKAAK